MATQSVSRQKSRRMPDPIPGIDNPIDGHSLIKAVDQIIGVVTLAEGVVSMEAGPNKVLDAAWTALGLALAALDDLRCDLEGVSYRRRSIRDERLQSKEAMS